jgi:hypothetical protein
LENDAKRVATIMGEFALAGGVQREAVHADLSGGGGVEAAEDVEEGAFAAATRAGDGGEVAGGEIEGDAVEGTDLAGAGGISSRDFAEFNHVEGSFSAM